VTFGSLSPWSFRATLIRGHDGDSIFVLADLGFSVRAEVELRLKDVRAPELGQPGGQETTDFVNGWLAAKMDPTLRWPFWIDVEMERTREPDMRMTFTRYVATIWPYSTTRDPVDSLNSVVKTFLSGHPEWPPGKLP
jgi:hypothetical protein